MRLDGRLRHAELIGDLLVEQPFGQHHQDPHLLRRQGREARKQRGGLGVRRRVEVDVGRRPHAALEHARDRVPHRLDAERLRDEARCAEIHAAANDRRLVIGRDDHHRHARILGAQIHQSGKAAHPRHGEIEQNEIDIGGAVEQGRYLLEGSGLGDIGRREQAGDCLAQCSAKQRMIVGNHQTILCGFVQPNVQFCLSSDGARLARAETGSGV